MKCLVNCRYVARPFAMIGCEVETIYSCYCWFLSQHHSSLAAEQIRQLSISLQSSPGTPQHCRTAGRRHRDQSYRVAHRGAYSRVERSSPAPPTYPRKDYQLLRWPSSNFTQRGYILYIYKHNTKKRGVMRAVHVCSCSIFCPKIWYLSGNSLLRLG